MSDPNDTTRRKKSRKLLLAQGSNYDIQAAKAAEVEDAGPEDDTKKDKKEIKIGVMEVPSNKSGTEGSRASEDTTETENSKDPKKLKDKRRRSLRDLYAKTLRKSRQTMEDDADAEAINDAFGHPRSPSKPNNEGKPLEATATKSRFLKKPFIKQVDKPDTPSTATKEDDELKNLIHSYGTDNDSGSDEDINKEDSSKFEPRKFDTHIVISDSSDEQLSDVADEDLNKSGRASGISYTPGEPTPHSHLDKLVDRAIGGGAFSTFPSEVTFQRGHRLSVYDAVEAHLLRQGKRTFLFRTVLVAKHEESSRDLIAWHSKTIESINAACYDELATGFFLIYPRYFVHVVEGSEETVSKFLIEHANKFDREKDEIDKSTADGKPQFKTVTSVIIGFFSIHERFLERWVYEKTKPYNRHVHKGPFRKRLFEFLKSTFILCTAVGRLPENHPLLTVKVDKPPDEPETEEDRVKGKEVLAVEYVQRMREIAQWMPSKKTLIDIMKKKSSRKIQLKTPREFIKSFWDLPPIILTSETDWPIPCRIAPYH